MKARKRAVLVFLSFASVVSAQPHYLRCFRDEAGVLREAGPEPIPATPETPPPTITIPPTTTTTIPSFSFNYTPRLHWKLMCPSGVFWGPWEGDVSRCTWQRSWLLATCPKKRVDKTDGFSNLEAIKAFREGCGADNGFSCTCVPEYF
jgi:hypothetical protein